MTETKTTETAAQTPSLDKKSLRKCLVRWIEFGQASYNYERMQGPDVLHAMVPIINKLYPESDIEGRRAAMKRHSNFFNTTLSFGSAIIGLVAAMEEKIAQGEKEIDDDAVNSIKTGLMGPIAGIGDTVNQGILLPLLLAIGIGLAIEGNVMGPILYTVLMVGAILAIAIFCFKLGYNKGSSAIAEMMSSGIINRIISGAGIMGCTVMGALVAKYVSLSTTVSFELTTGMFDLQANFFDALMPKLLPLLLTLLCYKLLNKGNSALRVMLYIVIGGVVLGLCGII